MGCGDCGRNPFAHFMVHNDLWVWHIPGPEYLCLPCAEKRLGRAFVPGDFPASIKLNRWVLEAFARGTHPTVIAGEQAHSECARNLS